MYYNPNLKSIISKKYLFSVMTTIVNQTCEEVKKTKKMAIIIAISMIGTFLLSLTLPAQCQSLQSSTAWTPTVPPPHLVFSQNLINAYPMLNQNPQPALGNPNYWDWGKYDLPPGTGYIGGYGVLQPYGVLFDTDWWSNVPEYWVDIVVKWSGQKYAEVGIDVQHNPLTNKWHAAAYAAYSEDPGGSGVVFAYYNLGDSDSRPNGATVATYCTGGSTWAYYVNGVQFATWTYSQYWTGYEVHSVTEAYNQPATGQSGYTISEASNIGIKRASDGVWVSPGLLFNQGITSGWMVGYTCSNGYHKDWSTRT